MKHSNYSVTFNFGDGNVINVGVAADSEAEAKDIAREFMPWIPADAKAKVIKTGVNESDTSMPRKE